MALYAPVCLLVLPFVWLLLVMIAFTAMFHALGVRGFERAFEMSGSSMFTLGFVRPPDLATTTLAFLEAASGLALLALLIAYLPTIYGAFSRREVLVVAARGARGRAALGCRDPRPRAADGALPTARRAVGAVAALVRRGGGDAHVARGPGLLPLTDRRTARGSRPRARCSTPRRCGLSAVDLPFDPQAGFCIRGGVFALRAVAAYFGLPFDGDPAPTDATSISEDEFLEACDRLVEAGDPRPRRSRAGLARLQRLAGELRPGAHRPRRPRDGAVRTLVVGPLAPLPAPDLRREPLGSRPGG